MIGLKDCIAKKEQAWREQSREPIPFQDGDTVVNNHLYDPHDPIGRQQAPVLQSVPDYRPSCEKELAASYAYKSDDGWKWFVRDARSGSVQIDKTTQIYGSDVQFKLEFKAFDANSPSTPTGVDLWVVGVLQNEPNLATNVSAFSDTVDPDKREKLKIGEFRRDTIVFYRKIGKSGGI